MTVRPMLFTLVVTDARVQRLQEIGEADAVAEGAESILGPPDGGSAPHVEGFRELWNSLNADRGFGCDSNLWVVSYTFRAIFGNIDQIEWEAA